MEKSIIADIYNGNINPYVKVTANETAYNEAMGVLTENEDKLNAVLSDSDREVFKKFADTQIDINSLTNTDKFVAGFKIGARVMMEVLADCN